MKWQVKPKAPGAFLKQFPEFSPLIAQLFYNRGLKTQKQIDEFFNPDYETDLHSPFLLKDMDKTVNRILKAIEQKEKILIYGDYDADGVCATAILFLTFKSLGVKNPEIYIPDRKKEKYGLNEQAIRNFAKKGINLIITVDCGSSDFEEIKLAQSLGIDVVVTDHHELRKRPSKVIALINPWQRGDEYPFKNLSGAGVAYKLAQALLLKKGDPQNFKKWLLDLAAIATVADVEPIIGENRTIVKYGLGVLAQTRWLGLEALMKTAKLNPEIVQHSINGEAPLANLNTYTLGFILGPRLNAAGRMNHANTAFNLLIADDMEKAKILAQEINQNNLDRQALTDKIIQEIEMRLNSQDEIPKLIFEGNPAWPAGIVGLAAGRIAEKYQRPTVIYQENEETVRASCRSIHQFDLMGMLNQCADYFSGFGGRKGTGGFRMEKEKLNDLRDSFIEIAEKELDGLELTPFLDIDAELSAKDINWDNYDVIQRFAPFGRLNPEPRFLLKGAELVDYRTVGNGSKHLKLEMIVFDNASGARKFNAIAFGMGDKRGGLKKGDLIDVVFELIANEWNNSRNLEIKIVDLKLSL